MFEITFNAVSDYRQIQMTDVILSANSNVCKSRDGEGGKE